MGASPWVGSGHTPRPPTLRGLNNPTQRRNQFGPFGADDNSRIVSVCLPTVGFTHGYSYCSPSGNRGRRTLPSCRACGGWCLLKSRFFASPCTMRCGAWLRMTTTRGDPGTGNARLVFQSCGLSMARKELEMPQVRRTGLALPVRGRWAHHSSLPGRTLCSSVLREVMNSLHLGVRPWQSS